MLRLGTYVRWGVVPLLTVIAASYAGAVTLDAYTDPLPPNPALPVTQARILWRGTYCDGLACPPDLTVTHSVDVVTQLGLPGAHGVGRFVGVGGTITPRTVLAIDAAAQRLRITAVDDDGSLSSIEYPEADQMPGLSLDFTEGGADAIGFDVSGTGIGGTATVVCWLLVSSGGIPWSEEHVQVIESPGPVAFPFDTFLPEIDFSDVDRIVLTIAVVGTADLAFSPIRSVARATPATARSWGGLKSRYR